MRYSTLSHGLSLHAVLIRLVKRLGCDLLEVVSHSFGLLENSLKAINKVLVVLVAIKDIKAGEHELILLLDQFVQELDVLLVSKVIIRERVHKLKQLLFVLWNWRHWPLHEGSELLRQSDELGAKLLLVNGSSDVAIDLSENVNVFL